MGYQQAGPARTPAPRASTLDQHKCQHQPRSASTRWLRGRNITGTTAGTKNGTENRAKNVTEKFAERIAVKNQGFCNRNISIFFSLPVPRRVSNAVVLNLFRIVFQFIFRVVFRISFRIVFRVIFRRIFRDFFRSCFRGSFQDIFRVVFHAISFAVFVSFCMFTFRGFSFCCLPSFNCLVPRTGSIGSSGWWRRQRPSAFWQTQRVSRS